MANVRDQHRYRPRTGRASLPLWGGSEGGGAARSTSVDLSPPPIPPAYSPHQPTRRPAGEQWWGESGVAFACCAGSSSAATGRASPARDSGLLQKPAPRGVLRLIFYYLRGESRLGVRSFFDNRIQAALRHARTSKCDDIAKNAMRSAHEAVDVCGMALPRE
jgi:hypothetical protein